MTSVVSMRLSYNREHPDGVWVIAAPHAFEAKDAVWSRPQLPNEDTGQYSWPADMRAEYERLTGKPEFDPNWEGRTMVNVVEMLADPDECAADTPCAWGHRVGCHAVYCHNDGWLYSPRKCRRRQDEPEWKHEDCPGFRANPLLTAPTPSPRVAPEELEQGEPT